MKTLSIFDLDGTLAESKSYVDSDMVARLNELLRVMNVAIISGGDWPQFEAQVLSQPFDLDGLRNLSLLPTCGTKFYAYKSTWEKLYSEDLTTNQKESIVSALKQTTDSLGLTPDKVWGEVIEDRGSQITFSALGQQAPLQEKKAWDPDFVKRKKMKALLDELIPDFSVRMGGTTSVDITRPGVDKAYGIARLAETLGIAREDMIFVGDALFPGGNDYPAKEAGVVCIEVKDPNETKLVIEAIVACMGPSQSPPPHTDTK
jgi:phosphomannomutase